MARVTFGYSGMKFMHNEDGSYLLEMFESRTIKEVKEGIEAFEEFVRRAEGLVDEKVETQVHYFEGEEV